MADLWHESIDPAVETLQHPACLEHAVVRSLLERAQLFRCRNKTTTAIGIPVHSRDHFYFLVFCLEQPGNPQSRVLVSVLDSISADYAPA